MNKSQNKVKELFEKLLLAENRKFPLPKMALDATSERGVYIIYNPTGKVVHVGRTPRAKWGIYQRLKDHLSGKSSFTYNYLANNPNRLRRGFTFKYIEVKNVKIMAYLEAYAIGNLCPEHIGVG